MARRRKKMPTKVERLTRRCAALEWALVQAREAGMALEAELLRLAGGMKPRLHPVVTFGPAAPETGLGFGTPTLEPVDELKTSCACTAERECDWCIAERISVHEEQLSTGEGSR